MNKTESIRSAVLGATGMVGQVFVHLLARHPRFALTMVCASEANRGKKYRDTVQWQLPFPSDPSIDGMVLEKAVPRKLQKAGIEIVFSGLPSEIARDLEGDLRREGLLVFSNAGAFRSDPEVPIVIPEANPGDLALVSSQRKKYGGAIVTNANCSTTGLAVALAPLLPFDPIEVVVSTYQSVSGAGYPGLAALDINHNAIPLIPGEEEKIRRELPEILHHELKIHATCVRIPVPVGHLESVWVRFRTPPSADALIHAWRQTAWQGRGGSFPLHPVRYLENPAWPQPRQAFWGTPPGMPVCTGRLRVRENMAGFLLLVNNLVKGGAGGSVQNAELLLSRKGGEG